MLAELADTEGSFTAINWEGGNEFLTHGVHLQANEAVYKPNFQSIFSLSLCSDFVSPPAIMSSCDCDRKDSNGGTCDSSCKEESFGIVEMTSSPVSFAPVLGASKAAGVEAVVSFEGGATHA